LKVWRNFSRPTNGRSQLNLTKSPLGSSFTPPSPFFGEELLQGAVWLGRRFKDGEEALAVNSVAAVPNSALDLFDILFLRSCMYNPVRTIIYLLIIFEWDEAKNRANLSKHGLDFESARRVFSDPLALLLPDPGSHNEDRRRIIGKPDDVLVVLVVFTTLGEAAEVYRIISDRRVTAHERKAYEES
jgi:hypothetical protein